MAAWGAAERPLAAGRESFLPPGTPRAPDKGPPASPPRNTSAQGFRRRGRRLVPEKGRSAVSAEGNDVIGTRKRALCRTEMGVLRAERERREEAAAERGRAENMLRCRKKLRSEDDGRAEDVIDTQ